MRSWAACSIRLVTHLDEITKQYEARAAREPKRSEAQLLLAKALLVVNSRDPKAEPLLRRAIALDPKNWEAHYQLGVMLSNRRDYPGAEKESSIAAELNPDEPTTHYQLGPGLRSPGPVGPRSE